MPKTITIEVLDTLKPMVLDMALKAKKTLPNCTFCSIRMEASEAKHAMANRGMPAGIHEDWEISLGAQVIAGEKYAASGYYGFHLGPSDLKNFRRFVMESISKSYDRAMATSRVKTDLKNEFPDLGKTIYSQKLAPIKIHQDTVVVPSRIDPRNVNSQNMLKYAVDISKEIASKHKEVFLNQQILETIIIRKIFVSSEGACIDQTFPMTELLSIAVVQPDDGRRATYYECLGNFAGWEAMEGKNSYNKTGSAFALDLAQTAARLAHAPVCPNPDKETVVVTNNQFNHLVGHEIVGHPAELDRILKMETAYAGRSRFFKNFDEHQIGEQVASPLISAFSDPGMPGYGHMKYDDEGVKCKKVYHIKAGVLTSDFLNSRETAHIMALHGIKVKPNGGMRARDPVLVPLIRMNNTCFENGESDPKEMIKEVKHGFYFKTARVPSISESRENFRISAVETWKIENGELTTLYRDGSVSSDSEKYLKSIDAVGNDFVNFPVFNCGKGQPMQAMYVGNGSPSMRGQAKIAGGHE